MPGPERRRTRLAAYDYAEQGAYFVTVCARDRACVFGSVVGDRIRPSELGVVVLECWRAISGHFPDVELDAFVVMPNHVHGVVILTRAGRARPLPTVIGSFKAAVSRQAGRPVWQRSFHDRIIRGDDELRALRRYVAENPLKWAVDHENPEMRRSS